MISAIDPNVVIAIVLAAAFMTAVLLVPFCRTPKGLWVLSLAAAAGFYRREFGGFLVVSVICYGAIWALGREMAPAKRWRWACGAIVGLALVFTLGRIGHWDRPFILFTAPMVLYSLSMWHVLRLITLFWEVGSGTLPAPSFTRYVFWICLPFSIAGPLLRWSQMPSAIMADRGLLKSKVWWSAASLATAKLAAAYALPAGSHFIIDYWRLGHFQSNALGTFITGPISFYLMAAGFCDCMQVLARPLGLKLPDSYNYPIGRENISAFWMNWNITATCVFRDYLFFNRWGMRTYNIYFNTILLFTLVGLWHAANAYWILWGFLHGLLFTTFLLWRKLRPRLGNNPLPATVSRTASCMLTYFSVCMCWYLPSKILQKLAGS